MKNQLIVRGAREHNLRGLDLDLPRDAMIVFTGLSGSGKSSLAFDTIFAEGQRRYVESLSPYARQFLGQLDKPDVDAIEGLAPAVAIDQKAGSRNPRSTVGTITEIYDHLRLLWARIGQPHCPVCGALISRQTPQQIVDELLDQPVGTRFYLLAPVAADGGDLAGLFDDLRNKGYARVRVDGTVYPLDSVPALDAGTEHTIEVVVDRLVARDSSRARITDSVETALKLSGGVVAAELVDRPADDPERERRFSEHLSCPNGHPVTLDDELEPKSFSFNSPLGACPVCGGLGTQREPDPELAVPDGRKTLAGGAVAPWSGWQEREYFTRLLGAAAKAGGFDLDTPWDELPAAARDAVLNGTGDQVRVSYDTRSGRHRSYLVRFDGVLPWIGRRYAEADTDSAREKFEGYMRAVPCPACGGARLRPEILAVTIAGRSIADVTALPISEAAQWLSSLTRGPQALGSRDEQVSARVRQEAGARLGFLTDVGLGYLSLNRPAATLAGGEAQRIRLATQIGSGLSGVLYVLDEPSIGLHQRDNEQLIATLTRLRDLGNTLIVVEHDEDTIRAADWVVDIGPGAGREGGEVVFSGPVADLARSAESITGAYLSGRRQITVPERRPRRDGHEIVVTGAREHNLRDIEVAFPLESFVAVTGVSGSGKSSLVNDILYPALANQVNGARLAPGRHTRVTGGDQIDKVIGVDQSPIGRSPRSNPATYTGVFDAVRELFAETTAAKVRGYAPGRFSFNVKGGRCEHCAGEGTTRIEMNFLPDVYVPCEVCHGARYNRDTLEVRYKGKNIAEVLDLTIAEACEFFGPIQRIARRLAALVKVGLGYVRLGQPATTLSGGEAQRVKLAAELQKRSTGRTLYVLDEPTTGLHFEDVRTLLDVLHALVDLGNTVVVIEHNLDVIKTADWVIDLGPDAGPNGGTVVAEGTPEQVAAAAASHTGRFLRPVLDGGHAVDDHWTLPQAS
ncbi:MAG TPA: excinuclease ABC subunit UvrA [Streptosporangiaceae bacterium]|nr:excinuclease ABC subunit UvrA [Streptosporangiaceae bacterium]